MLKHRVQVDFSWHKGSDGIGFLVLNSIICGSDWWRLGVGTELAGSSRQGNNLAQRPLKEEVGAGNPRSVDVKEEKVDEEKFQTQIQQTKGYWIHSLDLK